MKGKIVKIYAVNSRTLNNKIDSLRDIACKRELERGSVWNGYVPTIMRVNKKEETQGAVNSYTYKRGYHTHFKYHRGVNGTHRSKRGPRGSTESTY